MVAPESAGLWQSAIGLAQTTMGIDPLTACPVRQYAEDVTAGRIPAGKWVRLAAARHLRDLADGPARGLRWDADAAAHACEFFRFLRHSKGRWNAQVFDLSPWQSFIVGSIFGWKRLDG
jgi:phage terminase large subunit-like protein